ncbi:extracellular tyrosine-protein kinase PKDCC-like [Ptychodera flava]|uniref:extracellular tyrosine-protein kinase PKDCC-like n=1 Tax=Ptychodera flava TaxID=63121 RepID=UPI00396A1B25
MASVIMYLCQRCRVTPMLFLLIIPVVTAMYLIYSLHKQILLFPTNEISKEHQVRILHLQGLVEDLNNEISETIAERDLLREKVQFLVGNLSQQMQLLSKENGDTWMDKYLELYQNENFENEQLLGCKQLDTIQILAKIGQGYSKVVQEGLYGRTHVAVKSVAAVVRDVQSCLKSNNYKKTEDCYLLSNYKLLKEALMLRELKHESIVKLLGVCVRSENPSPYIHERGITSVVELGSRDAVLLPQLKKLPWIQRLKISQSLASLLSYMAESPLGSLRIPDFKEEQFVMVDDVIKLSDVDDVTNLEPSCDDDMKCLIDGREIGIQCHSSYRCLGMNSRLNFARANEVFLSPLLQHSAPIKLQNSVTSLLQDVKNFNVDANELQLSLQRLEKQYYKLNSDPAF